MFILLLLIVLQDFIQADVTTDDVRVYISSLDGLRLAKQPSVSWKKRDSWVNNALPIAQVNAETQFQRVAGFGASILQSGAMNMNSLNQDTQDELFDLMFSSKGARLSLMKIPIPCNDFCGNKSTWWTYDDVRDDFELRNFSIERDLEDNGTLTFVKKARAHGFDGFLQSYMDYPPDWMLRTDTPLPDATVNSSLYDVLANYYAKFVMAFREHNETIDYLSLFNEPMDSYTNISDEEISNLLGFHVGPLFDRLGLSQITKLTYGGQATRQSAAAHVPAIMSNENAARYMDHIAFHGYDCQFNCTKTRNRYQDIKRLHQDYPDLEILMTEICYAYNGDDPNCMHEATIQNCTDWPRNTSLAPPLPRLDFSDGRVWGSRIVSDFEAGVSGWIYWNLLLDMNGGPFEYSPEHADNGKNFQQAMFHVNAQMQTYYPTALFWYVAHFSKFVRPDSIRIDVSLEGNTRWQSDPDKPEGTTGIELLAFESDDEKTLILQILNHWNESSRILIHYLDLETSLNLPAISITTALWEKK